MDTIETKIVIERLKKMSNFNFVSPNHPKHMKSAIDLIDELSQRVEKLERLLNHVSKVTRSRVIKTIIKQRLEMLDD